MFHQIRGTAVFYAQKIFLKNPKFFFTDAGTFLFFLFVLYMDGDKAAIIFSNVIEREKQQYFHKNKQKGVRYKMTNSSLWEQENQEKLRDDYFYRCAHGIQNNYVYPIRRIICEGCGNIFYTMVPVKKYCNERCCYLGFWKHKREKRLAMRKDTVCKTCGNTFTPKRSGAVYCSNACRQKAYRQSVTDNGKCSK